MRRREREPIERTGELVDVDQVRAIPAPARFGEGHPAKRVFQALRIEVNDELESLEAGLPAAFEMLRPGGRLAVICFHSLEDRIVKRFLRDRAKGCTCPPDFRSASAGKSRSCALLTPKPVRPSAHELDVNPRAASARLRAAVASDVGDAQAGRARRRTPRSCAVRRRRRASRVAQRRRALDRLSPPSCSPGVVAVNVAVLRLNLQLDDSGRSGRSSRPTSPACAELSSAAAATRIERLARGELGLRRRTARGHDLHRARQ